MAQNLNKNSLNADWNDNRPKPCFEYNMALYLLYKLLSATRQKMMQRHKLSLVSKLRLSLPATNRLCVATKGLV